MPPSPDRTAADLGRAARLDRLPPALAPLDSEEIVVGVCLGEPEAIADVRAHVSPGDFVDTALGEILAAAVALYDADAAVDPVALANALDERGTLATVGGRERIALLIDAWVPRQNLPHHAALVRAAAHRRALVQLAQRLQREAADPAHDPTALAQQAAGDLLPFAAATDGDGFRPAADRLWAVVEDVESRVKLARTGRVPGLPTGFPELDNLFGGFRPGEFIVIGAGPKMGKTTLALGILANVIDDGHGGGLEAGMVSAEMTRDELVEGLIAQRGGFDRSRLALGRIHDDELVRLARTAGEMAHPLRRLHVDDVAFPSLDDVIARACQLKAAHPNLAFLVVDYLQLITKEMRGRRGDEEIGAVCRGLKGLAKRLNVPVLAPAQVNYKDTDRRSDPRPKLADLQGGSGMAQTANHVLLLHRPGRYEPADPYGTGARDDTLEVEVAASRRVPNAQITMGWDGARMRVYSRARPALVRDEAA